MNEAAELGPRLRTEREHRGLSIRQVADELRLDAWVIEALEAGAFERIGAPVYAKGHLKKYASLLGVACEAAAAGIDALNSPPASAAAETALRLPSPSLRRKLPWRPAVALLVLAALIAAGALWWRHPRHLPRNASGARIARPSAAAASTVIAAGGIPAAALDVATAGAARPAAARGARPAAAGATGELGIRLAFSADCWVNVRDAAGKSVFAGIGRAGSARKIVARAPLAVILGFVRGVTMQIDGRATAVAPRFVHGNVGRFAIGTDSALRSYASQSRPRD
ncbi:MAG TPA: helix-turn-helix domain-containing protein [Steroidobacteraceae bacterium]|nr:helix-turn-helix domain-containing protein [Steroidobacteraceae bacterium]